jgi:hypothetical protein
MVAGPLREHHCLPVIAVTPFGVGEIFMMISTFARQGISPAKRSPFDLINKTLKTQMKFSIRRIVYAHLIILHHIFTQTTKSCGRCLQWMQQFLPTSNTAFSLGHSNSNGQGSLPATDSSSLLKGILFSGIV